MTKLGPICLTALCFAAPLSCVSCAHANPSESTVVLQPEHSGVQVSGSGEAEATPDVGRFTVAVEVRRPTLEEARAGAATTLERVLEALRKLGLSQDDLRTEQISMGPEYDYSQQGRQLLGYLARQAVEVRVREVTNLGSAMDAAVQAGGDDVRVQGVELEISNKSAVRAQARERAMAQARASAEHLAKLGGVTLGPPRYISEREFSPDGPRPVMMQMRSEMRAAPETPVEPGVQKLRVEVNVIYGIE